MAQSNNNLPAGVTVDVLDTIKTPDELKLEIQTAIDAKIEKAYADIKKLTKNEYVTANKIELLEKAKFVLDNAINNALIENAVPRSWEVLAKVFDSISNLIDKLTETDIEPKPVEQGTGTNNQTVILTTEKVISDIIAARYKKAKGQKEEKSSHVIDTTTNEIDKEYEQN